MVQGGCVGRCPLPPPRRAGRAARGSVERAGADSRDTRRAVRLLLVLGLLVGCTEPPTQVAVRVATDMRAPDDFDALALRIVDDAGDVVREQMIVAGLADLPADRRYHQVGSFGLVPRAGDAERGFEVRVGVRHLGRERFETRAISHFLRRRTIRLDVYAAYSCLEQATSCEPDETCGVPGCVSPVVDPEALPPAHRSDAPIDEESPVDPRGRGGRDAGPAEDAGPGPDSGGDGGGDDAGPRPEVDHGLRPARPLTGARWLSSRPSFVLAVESGVTADAIDLCPDPRCDSVDATLPVSVSTATVPAPLAPGIVFWRARGARGGVPIVTPTRPLEIPDRAGSDAQCGYRFDADGDGSSDLVVGAPTAAGGAGRVFLYLSSVAPAGTWVPEVLEAPPGASGLGAVVDGGDVDADGRADVLAGAPGSRTAHAFLRADPGSPVELPAPSPTGAFARSLAFAGDVDGDGYGDVAVLEEGDELVVRVFTGGPTGPLTTPRYAVTVPGAFGATPRVFAAGDMDEDGRDELVVGTPDVGPVGTLHILRGTSAGPAYVGAVDASLDLSPGAELGTSIVAAELSGDGECDLLAGLPGEGSGVGGTIVLDGLRGVAVSPAGRFVGPVEGNRLGQGVASDDVDGDGMDEPLALDVATATRTSHLIVLGVPAAMELHPVSDVPVGFGNTVTTLGAVSGRAAGVVAAGGGGVVGLLVDVRASPGVVPELLTSPAGADDSFGAALR